MNPLNYPTDNMAALAVLVAIAWIAFVAFIIAASHQPQDGE